MLKKSITFENFDGVKVTEDHYFHLSVKSIITMENEARAEVGMPVDASGNIGTGLEKWLQREIDSGEEARALAALGKFIDKGYGLRVGDTGFKQSREISDDFASSLAFDAFFLDMMTNEDEAIRFVTGMMPSQLRENPEVVKKLREAGLSENAVGSVRHIADRPLPYGPEVPQRGPGVIKLEPVSEDLSDAEFERMREDELSGLKNPRNIDGSLLPWAFRDPKREEISKMTRQQYVDVKHRKNSGDWVPSVGG